MGERERVILFGIDGLRPDMVTEASMPNLTALRRRGVWCSNHRTVFPSETRGALTALATGTPPAVNGVLGNQFYARDGQTAQTCTHTIDHWQAADATLQGGMVNAPGLAELLAREGRSLAVVTSSGQGSLAALNWKGALHGQPASTSSIRTCPSQPRWLLQFTSSMAFRRTDASRALKKRP